MGAVLHFMSLFGSGESIRPPSSGVYMRGMSLVIWGWNCEDNAPTSEALAVNTEAVMHTHGYVLW